MCLERFISAESPYNIALITTVNLRICNESFLYMKCFYYSWVRGKEKEKGIFLPVLYEAAMTKTHACKKVLLFV